MAKMIQRIQGKALKQAKEVFLTWFKKLPGFSKIHTSWVCERDRLFDVSIVKHR